MFSCILHVVEKIHIPLHFFFKYSVFSRAQQTFLNLITLHLAQQIPQGHAVFNQGFSQRGSGNTTSAFFTDRHFETGDTDSHIHACTHTHRHRYIHVTK